MLLVVGDLDLATPVRLRHRLVDRLGHLVRVQEHLPVDVASRTPDRLDERGATAEEALLVRVEHRDERDLRQVEALAQEVHADEHVELAEAELTDDPDAVERVDFRVEVARSHPGL